MTVVAPPDTIKLSFDFVIVSVCALLLVAIYTIAIGREWYRRKKEFKGALFNVVKP